MSADDEDWETDPNYLNDVTEAEQRYGSKSVPGSGRVGYINFDKIITDTKDNQKNLPVKEKIVIEKTDVIDKVESKVEVNKVPRPNPKKFDSSRLDFLKASKDQPLEKSVNVKSNKIDIKKFEANVKIDDTSSVKKEEEKEMEKKDIPKADPSPKKEEQKTVKKDLSNSVRALFSYTAEEEDELSFEEGDIITDVEKFDPGWWKGKFKGEEGIFPSNYVESLS